MLSYIDYAITDINIHAQNINYTIHTKVHNEHKFVIEYCLLTRISCAYKNVRQIISLMPSSYFD